MADGFITIPLSEADERALREAAAARGVPVEEEAARLLASQLDAQRRGYALLQEGLDDEAAGNWASEEEIKAAFAMHGVEWR